MTMEDYEEEKRIYTRMCLEELKKDPRYESVKKIAIQNKRN